MNEKSCGCNNINGVFSINDLVPRIAILFLLLLVDIVKPVYSQNYGSQLGTETGRESFLGTNGAWSPF